jgi:hypothetical protein
MSARLCSCRDRQCTSDDEDNEEKVVPRYECKARGQLYTSAASMSNHTYSTFLRKNAFHDYNDTVCGSSVEAIARTKRNMDWLCPFALSKSWLNEGKES